MRLALGLASFVLVVGAGFAHAECEGHCIPVVSTTVPLNVLGLSAVVQVGTYNSYTCDPSGDPPDVFVQVGWSNSYECEQAE
jgi:hypothetical protein